MATHQAGGSTQNGRDSKGRRLGLKKNSKQFVNCGSIIVRQRGTKYKCGQLVNMGKDHTIHASCAGFVYFTQSQGRTFVNILPPN